MKKIISILLSLTLILGLLAGCSTPAAEGECDSPAPSPSASSGAGADTVLYTDNCGREVEIPTDPQRIAALYGPTFEASLLLGLADRVVASMGGSLTAWAQVVYPRAAEIASINNPQTPNVEDLTALDVDLVMHWSTPDALENMENAGLTALGLSAAEPTWSTTDEYVQAVKDEYRTYATVLGDDAMERYQLWEAYFDEKLDYLDSRISTLSQEDYPTVYYIRSNENDGLQAYLNHHGAEGEVMLAGGTLVTGDYDASVNSYGTVTMEDVIGWDPEIIILGRCTYTGMIYDNPAWSSITAVQNGDVYVGPNGVFYWDSSSERVLNILWLAKLLHPDLFEDLDMVAEVQEYYSTFYGYDLSEEHAKLILAHQDPA